jgi:RNA polymerase sigma factor (sigma-70 family)
MQAPPHSNHSRGERPTARDRPAAKGETTEVALAMASPPTSPFGEPDPSHLDGAYNLASWLTQSDQQAREVVQQAVLEVFGSRSATANRLDGRSLLMATVRSACYARLQTTGTGAEDNEKLACDANHGNAVDGSPDTRSDPRRLINAALQRLPIELREVIVLRELEDLSYAVISSITGVPVCAVMSRLGLARARLALQIEQ